MKRDFNFTRKIVAPLAIVTGMGAVVGISIDNSSSSARMSYARNDEAVEQIFFDNADKADVEKEPYCIKEGRGFIYKLETNGVVTKILTNPCEKDLKPTLMGAYAECLVVTGEAEVIDYPYKFPPTQPEKPKSDREVLASLNKTEQACVVLARSAVPYDLQECIAERYYPYHPTTTTTFPEQITSSTIVSTTIPDQVIAACREAVNRASQIQEAPAATPIPAPESKVTG